MFFVFELKFSCTLCANVVEGLFDVVNPFCFGESEEL